MGYGAGVGKGRGGEEGRYLDLLGMEIFFNTHTTV